MARRELSMMGLLLALAGCGGGADARDGAPVDGAPVDAARPDGMVFDARPIDAPPVACTDGVLLHVLDQIVGLGVCASAGQLTIAWIFSDMTVEQHDVLPVPEPLYVPWPASSMNGESLRLRLDAPGTGDCSGIGVADLVVDRGMCVEPAITMTCFCGPPDAGQP